MHASTAPQERSGRDPSTATLAVARRTFGPRIVFAEPGRTTLTWRDMWQTLRAARPRDVASALVGYYREPMSWLALFFTSVMMCYVGGAAMFWFHAEHLGEGGPAIAWYDHWLLDSTFGFVVLTPVLALLLPAAAWAGQRGARQLGEVGLTPWLYAIVAGTAFAVIATPGPLAHDLVVGRGTWIASHVTQLLGNPNATLSPVHPYSPLAKMTQQLGFGLPLYIALMIITTALLRGMAARPNWERSEAVVQADSGVA